MKGVTSRTTNEIMKCNGSRRLKLWKQTLICRKHNRHNSADSVPTSNLVCIKEVAIRTTFSLMINIAGIIY